MAGTVKANQITLGDSATDTQNFALKTNVDGTMKLARKSDASGGDILTVDSSGKVAFPQGMLAFLGSNQSLAANGYQKLPGGLIIQWGSGSASVGGTAVTFPIAFTTVYVAVANNSNQANPPAPSVQSLTASGFTAVVSSGSPAIYWIAIGV